MRLLIVATIIVFVSASIPGFAIERRCPETIHNSYECAQYLEKQLGKEYPALFSRSGTKLVVRFTKGAAKTYVDTADKDDACGIWYSFVQYFPEIRYGVVEAQYYEGGTRYLLNMRTGKETEIIGYPVLSSDKKRIAVSSVDIEAEYTPNVLSVYKVQSDSLIVEFHEEPTDWGPGNLRWATNKEITFIRYSRDCGPPNEPCNASKTLKYRGVDNKGIGRWYIE